MISGEHIDGYCKLRIQGDMTIYTAEELRQELLNEIVGDEEVEIDLSEVHEMDTAGFQLLVMAKRECEKAGRPLSFVSHSAEVMEVLELYNMAAYFGDPVVLTA